MVINRARAKGGGSLVLPTKTEQRGSVLADDRPIEVNCFLRRVDSWGGGTVGCAG